MGEGGLMIQFQIPLVNGTVEVPIELASHQEATFHKIQWGFISQPSSGTFSLEGKQTDGSYIPISSRASERTLTSGNSLLFVGSFSGLRFTISGVTGGSGAVVTLWSYDQSPTLGPPEGVYTGSRALTVQSYIESNCKNGAQYELTTYTAGVASGAIRDFIIITGDKPVLLKNRLFQFTGERITTSVFRGPTYTGGTPIAYYNLNDINPVAGTIQVLGTPTVTSVGTQVSPTTDILGNLPQGGQSFTATEAESGVVGLERIFRPNTTYLFRTINNSAAAINISSRSTWYEGFPDIP